MFTRAKSGSVAPGPKSAPRGTKSITFAKGFFQLFNLPKFLPNSVGEPSFFTHAMSDIHIRPGWSLRSFRNWRLVCSELRIKTFFQICGSSIGYVQIKSNQLNSNQIKSNQLNSQLNTQLNSIQLNDTQLLLLHICLGSRVGVIFDVVPRVAARHTF